MAAIPIKENIKFLPKYADYTKTFYHRKWLEDVDVGIVAEIGLIQSLDEPKPS